MFNSVFLEPGVLLLKLLQSWNILPYREILSLELTVASSNRHGVKSSISLSSHHFMRSKLPTIEFIRLLLLCSNPNRSTSLVNYLLTLKDDNFPHSMKALWSHSYPLSLLFFRFIQQNFVSSKVILHQLRKHFMEN